MARNTPSHVSVAFGQWPFVVKDTCAEKEAVAEPRLGDSESEVAADAGTATIRVMSAPQAARRIDRLVDVATPVFPPLARMIEPLHRDAGK